MNPTNEEKKRIRELLVYDAAKGTLQWSNMKNDVDATYEDSLNGRLYVDLLGYSYEAADACWFLHYRQWPTHGVVMSDKSPSGRLNLQFSNLRRRRKPEYVKKGRAVWVPRQVAEMLVFTMKVHGLHGPAMELEVLLAKETKR